VTTAQAWVGADPGGAQCTELQQSNGGHVSVILFCAVRPAAAADASAHADYYSMGGQVYADQTDDLSYTDAQADSFFSDRITIDRAGFQGTGGQVYFDVVFSGTATASGSGGATASLVVKAKFDTFPAETILNLVINDSTPNGTIEASTQRLAFRYGESFPLDVTLALDANAGGAPGTAQADFAAGATILRLNVAASGGVPLDPALYTVMTDSGIPVPEPGSAASHAAAIAALGLVAMRRRGARRIGGRDLADPEPVEVPPIPRMGPARI
jgi:hypothetical protein